MKSSSGITLTIIIVLIVFGIWFGGTNYIVTHDNGMTTVKKAHFQLSPMFINVSNWGLTDLASNPEIVAQFIKQGKGHLLPGGKTVQAMLKMGEAGIDKLVDISNSGVESFRELDKKYDLSGKMKKTGQAVSDFDQKYQVSNKAKQASDNMVNKAKELDEKYELQKKAEEAKKKAKKLLGF